VSTKRTEHKHYVTTVGDDMPEVRNWRWSEETAKQKTSTEGDNQ
jgi:hypothetical protein